MGARHSGGWLFGASLLVLTSLVLAPVSGAFGSEIADAPELAFVLPEQPEIAVEVPAPEAGAAPVLQTATPAPFEPEAPAAVVITAADVLPEALQLRLADPKLPLPAKLSRRDREALGAFYGANRFRPLWLADGAWNDAGRAVARRLARADEDGLDPADYPVPNLAAGSAPLGAGELAEAELKLSAVAYLYARDARGGRLEPSRISGLITPKMSVPGLDAVLPALAGSPDPDRVLLGYQPVYPGYRALRDKLAEIRASRPSGPLVRSSGAALASAGGPTLGLAKAPSPRLEGDIVANMERWRWLPAEMAPRQILVNVPEYRLRLIEDGRVTHETRVIAGRAATPTPIFSGTMDHAIVNPSWFIPPSILRKEILPGLAKDPEYASRRGYSVVRRGSSVSVRQPPGPRNALGYIKFMFPNDHAVYLHDTPNRNLFGSAQRAFSHGCVRVEQPFALGGRILGAAWTEARLKSLIGYGERMITLSDKLPVHLAYFTVSVDEAGEVRTFDDVYGYHRRVRAALGLGA